MAPRKKTDIRAWDFSILRLTTMATSGNEPNVLSLRNAQTREWWRRKKLASACTAAPERAVGILRIRFFSVRRRAPTALRNCSGTLHARTRFNLVRYCRNFLAQAINALLLPALCNDFCACVWLAKTNEFPRGGFRRRVQSPRNPPVEILWLPH